MTGWLIVWDGKVDYAHRLTASVIFNRWFFSSAGSFVYLVVSNKFGYGLLDADKVVEHAKSWQSVAEQHVCSSETFTDARSFRVAR